MNAQAGARYSLKGGNQVDEMLRLAKRREEWKSFVRERYGGEENAPAYDSFDLYLSRQVEKAEREKAAQTQEKQKVRAERNLALALCAALLLVALIFAFRPVAQAPASDASAGVAGQTPVAISERNFVASVNSDKFHRPTCDYAENISPENRVYYATAQEAEDAGKTPCSVCRPGDAQESRTDAEPSFSSWAEWNKLHEAGCISMTYQEWLDFWVSRENGAASDFLREAAEVQAEKIDEEYGPWAYGGTGWGLWTALRDAGYTSASIEEFSEAME